MSLIISIIQWGSHDLPSIHSSFTTLESWIMGFFIIHWLSQDLPSIRSSLLCKKLDNGFDNIHYPMA